MHGIIISDSLMARKAVIMFKDSYALEFINTEEIGERDKQDIDEKVVEQQIIQNIKNFIMTFGNDFAFVGNQYHLEIYGDNPESHQAFKQHGSPS